MKTLKLSANGYWKFYRGKAPKGKTINSQNPHDVGVAVFDPRYDDSTWETVFLPHTVREERLNCSGGYNYVGECWYRKKFIVEEEWEGKSLFIEFEGAMQRMDAWLDGKPLGVKYGGFLPHGFDLSGLKSGEHLLVLKLDNSDCFDIPPAKPQGALDFCYFGGLYRNAWFYISEKLHFSRAVHENKIASGGLFVRYPFVSREKATVRVSAHAVNGNRFDVLANIQLYFGDNKVAEQEVIFPANGDATTDFEFDVKNPKLWSPYEPNLYDVTVKLIVSGEVIDEKTEWVGIREITFERGGVLVNGEKIYLSGVNRHQEYAYVGFAVTDSLQYRDLKMLRDMGAICIRTAHYPADPTFMSYCDELGIFCIIPTPGWQIHPSSVQFDERSFENTRRMIRLHRNHPSVLLWEPILNETDYAEYFALEQLKCVREELADSKWYCGCDPQSRHAELFPVHLKVNNNEKIPALLREYGDSYIEQYGPMSTRYRVRRGENTGFYPGGEDSMVWSANARYERYKYYKSIGLSGACLWNAIDCNRGYETNEGAWGVLDFLRLKKYSYYMYESQQDYDEVGGKCFIANEWTEASPCDISVYTNAEEVKLYVNNKEIESKFADGMQKLHPPVLFKNVPFEKGILRAEALIDGHVVASYEVRTPETAKKLILVPHWEGVEKWIADGSDLLMVHVLAVDETERVNPAFEEEVFFEVEGDATIVGDGLAWTKANPTTMEAGKCGVLLRAGLTAGKIVLKAYSNGLQAGELVLYTQANNRKDLPCVRYEKNAERPTYEIDETEVFSVPLSIKQSEAYKWDVGVNKEAWASSCAEGSAAENVNRKTIGEPWLAASAELPQTWQCDLGKEYPLNGIFIGWELDWIWYDYEVEISLDGKEFVSVIRGKESGQSRIPDRFPTGTVARYVRVVVRAMTTEMPAGIYRVEIFGNPNA